MLQCGEIVVAKACMGVGISIRSKMLEIKEVLSRSAEKGFEKCLEME